jgi:sulfotransferase
MERVPKQLVFLSGLPRSGSTLLSSILGENPLIHAEGNSAVCQLMWDMSVSCETSCSEQLVANNRFDTQKHLVSEIPQIYYQNTDRPVVVDKCRSWTLESNVRMIKEYICPNPKIIVLTRPIDEIVQSFIRLGKENGKVFKSKELLSPGSEPIMRSLNGVDWAKKNNAGEFLFVEYSDLVSYTKEVIASIYSFCGWDNFEHDLSNIVNRFPENDSVYGLAGMHEVRLSPCFRTNG